MSAESLERQAATELALLLGLPPASGTATNLVRLLVDAAVARMAEQPKQTLSLPQRASDTYAPVVNDMNARQATKKA